MPNNHTILNSTVSYHTLIYIKSVMWDRKFLHFNGKEKEVRYLIHFSVSSFGFTDRTTVASDECALALFIMNLLKQS
jgi:hypothetical protein